MIFAHQLTAHPRLLICGGPRTGKTKLACAVADLLGILPQHTDNVIPMGWSEGSELVSAWMDAPGPLVIEGVAVVRALRKWLKRNPSKRPDFALVLLDKHVAPVSEAQARMTKGIHTVWDEIADECDLRGMVIIRGSVT